MDRIVALAPAERSALFSETAARLGMTPAVAEKDFWVTWVLGRLFADAELGRLLLFKGGTSLAKAYRVIERFSEDIDLILDWRTVTGEDPHTPRTRTAQDKLNAAIDAQARTYISRELLPRVNAALGGHCACAISSSDPQVIDIRYPAAFPDTYLRPELRLEIGPLAAWLPHEQRPIRSYAAECFPDLFQAPETTVRVIRAERTFWEKATILHHEANRPAGSVQPARYSRHYYDLARMAKSPIKTAALADTELLAEVVAFKQRFYPRPWARYELARPGTLRLVPPDQVLLTVRTDYTAMATMLFGDVPTFEAIIATLATLETEINRPSP